MRFMNRHTDRAFYVIMLELKGHLDSWEETYSKYWQELNTCGIYSYQDLQDIAFLLLDGELLVSDFERVVLAKGNEFREFWKEMVS